MIDLEDWAIEHTDENGKPTNLFAWAILWYGHIYADTKFRYHRSICAIKGCHMKSYHSDYLPEDCYEWWCTRCGASGMNEQAFGSYDEFDGENKCRDLISAIKGK